ncbi:submandibular gland protein C-like [Apodemus sylvaticus]|uniref:submandibular gland protein C-like n=1 Tax=Apodemus sylvaticus TaxID=10129 RepID=UPI0022431CCA|nr:submandibular gland protein C-like [Apodemus sylvaticus]
MKLILLYLAVVLCTVCKAAVRRKQLGIHGATVTGLRLLASGKNIPNAKSSGESQNDNGGKSNLENELNFGIGGSTQMQSSLETSGAHSLPRSGTYLNPNILLNAAMSALSEIKSLSSLGGSIQAGIKVGAKTSGRGGSVSGTTSGNIPPNELSTDSGNGPPIKGQNVAASGTQELNADSSSSPTGSATSSEGADKHSDHSRNPLMNILEKVSESTRDTVASAVEKFEDTIKRLEAMSKNHGQTSTSASVSGTSRGSSSLNVPPSNIIPKESNDEPRSQGQNVAASGKLELNADSSSSPTGSATSSEGADKHSDHSRNPLINILEKVSESTRDTVASAVEKFEDTIKRLEAMSKNHGQTSTSASVSGTSRGSSSLNVPPSNIIPKESNDEPRSQGQNVAASGKLELNAHSSSSPTGSATSSEGGTSSVSSRMNVPPSSRLPMESNDDPTAHSKDVAASGTQELDANSSSSSTGSATSSEGACIPVNPHEEVITDVLKNLASHIQQTHTDAHHSCSQISECERTASGNNIPPNELSTDSGNGSPIKGQNVAASGTQELNADSSSSPTHSATSSEGGASNKVSGLSSSAVVSTDSGDRGNQDHKQVPGLTGHKGEGESLGAGSLDIGNKSGSGSHNLSSEYGSSIRSKNSADNDPVQNEPTGHVVSGSVTCPTGNTLSGSPSVD